MFVFMISDKYIFLLPPCADEHTFYLMAINHRRSWRSAKPESQTSWCVLLKTPQTLFEKVHITELGKHSGVENLSSVQSEKLCGRIDVWKHTWYGGKKEINELCWTIPWSIQCKTERELKSLSRFRGWMVIIDKPINYLLCEFKQK